MRTLPALAASLLTLAVANAANANMLVNGGLETTKHVGAKKVLTVSKSKNKTALTGWTVTSGTVDIVPNTFWQSSEGRFSIDMIGTPAPGSIQQNVSTVIGEDYILTFDFAINPSNKTHEVGSTKLLLVEAKGGSSEESPASQVYSSMVGTRTTTNMQYIHETFQFTATSTMTTLVLSALAPSGLPRGRTVAKSYCGPVIDNLVLELADSEPTGSQQSVPEPASLALLGLGVPALLFRRRSSAL